MSGPSCTDCAPGGLFTVCVGFPSEGEGAPVITKLSIAATTDASFLTLLRSDNASVIEQIMPEDGTNYYEFMQSYRPDWYEQGVPDVPPATINITSGDILVTSADMKSMVLDGWS